MNRGMNSMLERLELSLERIKEIKTEKKLQKEYQAYFEKVAEFLLLIEENRCCSKVP